MVNYLKFIITKIHQVTTILWCSPDLKVKKRGVLGLVGRLVGSILAMFPR
jgi:hypothetical protein